MDTNSNVARASSPCDGEAAIPQAGGLKEISRCLSDEVTTPPDYLPDIAMNFSLAQITRPGPVLLLDSASSRAQAALFRPSLPALWETRDDEAGVALFSCAEKLLARASLEIADIAAFIFCDGPGSVLGIRTAAVALRAWRAMRERPAYAYCSLALVARHLLATDNARNLSLIADAPLLTPAPEPDAFLHEEPVYQTWTPRAHRGGGDIRFRQKINSTTQQG
jgi:hypothetical protein